MAQLAAQKQLPKFALTGDIPAKPQQLVIAKQVAERVGVPHRIIGPEYSRGAEDEVWKDLHTDFMAMEHR